MPRWVLLLICPAVAVGVADQDTPPPSRATTSPVIALPAPEPVEDPFPIRRLRASESQLPEVLKQLDAGPLIRLPRAEFEARVRTASRAVAEARVVPRITGAEFRATLIDEELVGTATLQVVNPSRQPRLLPLEPLRVAVRRATWDKDREAILGVPAGGTGAGVWVDRPGSQTLRFDWTATGTTEPGERRFELHLPTTPTATLDLELPADRVPTASPEVLLTGPFPLPGQPARARWHIRFGGRSRLEFAVRPAVNPVVAATAALVARYDLAPGQVACTFEYDLRPARGTVGEWTFNLDPGLRVTDVVVNNRAAWVVESVGWWTDARRLRVTLRQPGAGGKVTVSAVALFPTPPAGGGVTLPMVRPVGGYLDEETLEVRLAAGLKLNSWDPGDYRLTDSLSFADHVRILTLRGTLAAATVDRPFRRPPTLRAVAVESDFTTTEQVTWQFDAGGIAAVVRVGVLVRRGALFQLAVKAPDGYTLRRVGAVPEALVAYSGFAARTATAEFARPLTAGDSAELTFEFRGPALAPGSHQLPFPAFTPLGTSERDGVLGLCPGSHWRIEARPGPGSFPVGWLDLGVPEPPSGAVAAFRYQGGDPDGLATLTPVQPRPAAPVATLPPPQPGTAEPPPASTRWAFEGVYLVTVVRSLSDVLVVFGGTATAVGGRSIPVRLPAGAELRAAGIGGRWLEPGTGLVNADNVVNLPCPKSGPLRFEVRYRLPVESGVPAGVVRSPEPELPEPAGEVRRWWAFSPQTLPGWPVRVWEHGRTTDLPGLLGDSPLTAVTGVIVSRSPVEAVRVGPRPLADALGFGMAAAIALLSWAAGRRPHPAYPLLTVGGLLVIGVAALLGPPWWQRAAAIPLIVGLIAAAGMIVVRGHRSLTPLAAVVLLGGLLTWSSTAAQPLAPAVVVLLPADAAGRETVVAPKAVVDRLDAVAAPTSPGVILTAAGYSVRIDHMSARVTAKFTAHAPSGDDSAATLPLADARLEHVRVNGKEAFPGVQRPGVYRVPLPGSGPFEIEVQFAVPVSGTGPDRELRFGVPECPFTHLTADLPPSARQPQVVGRIGRQTTISGEKRVRVEADVGTVRMVQLRWRDGPGGAAAVRVREGCVWDVSEAEAQLTACYLVRIEQGTVSSLQFELPAELDAQSVAVRPLDPATTVGLRDWSVSPDQNGYRPLRIEFQGPTAGRILVVLTCDRRTTITRQPVLRFPRVVLPGDQSEPDAVYGLRARGVVIEELPRSGVIDFTPDALTRDFAAVAELRLDPAVPVRVFRPVPGAVPELRPTLRVAGEPPAVTLDTTWHVGPHRADAVGMVRWLGKDAMPLLEFGVPGVRVTEVRGAEVSGWSQDGSRVQVWLRRGGREGEVEWRGTLAIAPPRATTPPVFDAVTPRVIHLRLVADTLRLRPADGWAARVERAQGWDVESTADGFTFRATGTAAPPVRLVLTPASPTNRPDDNGWFVSKSGETVIPPPREVLVDPMPAVVTAAELPQPRWVWPVSTAVVWTVGIAGLAVLVVRFPHSTWPEQIALLGGLFGAAVVGHWWVAAAAWLAARLAWLVERTIRGCPATTGPLMGSR